MVKCGTQFASKLQVQGSSRRIPPRTEALESPRQDQREPHSTGQPEGISATADPRTESVHRTDTICNSASALHPLGPIKSYVRGRRQRFPALEHGSAGSSAVELGAGCAVAMDPIATVATENSCNHCTCQSYALCP